MILLTALLIAQPFAIPASYTITDSSLNRLRVAYPYAGLSQEFVILDVPKSGRYRILIHPDHRVWFESEHRPAGVKCWEEIVFDDFEQIWSGGLSGIKDFEGKLYYGIYICDIGYSTYSLLTRIIGYTDLGDNSREGEKTRAGGNRQIPRVESSLNTTRSEIRSAIASIKEYRKAITREKSDRALIAPKCHQNDVFCRESDLLPIEGSKEPLDIFKRSSRYHPDSRLRFVLYFKRKMYTEYHLRGESDAEYEYSTGVVDDTLSTRSQWDKSQRVYWEGVERLQEKLGKPFPYVEQRLGREEKLKDWWDKYYDSDKNLKLVEPG